jgi:hypothetical protein
MDDFAFWQRNQRVLSGAWFGGAWLGGAWDAAVARRRWDGGGGTRTQIEVAHVKPL